MLFRSSLATIGSTLLVASALSAQSDSRLLALTAATPIVQSQDLMTCQARRCLPAGFPSVVSQIAGGIAYDTRFRGAWITNGNRIARIDPRAATCPYQCPIQPLPPTSVLNSVATGLAHLHRGNQLYVTDSANVIRVLQIGNNGCSLTTISRCQVLLPLNSVLTGIAIDDVNQLLYYCSSSNQGPTFGGGRVHVARLNDPCNPFCSVSVATCPNGQILGPLRGIAYEGCTNTIWVTDGQLSVQGRVSLPNCTWNANTCCPSQTPNSDPYVGLTILPSTEQQVGVPCSNGACPNCAPTHTLASDPVLGNLDFRVLGSNLPANTIGATLFNLGPCDPVGIVIPPFCGPLHVNLTPTLLGFSQNTGGTIGCTGTTNLLISVPPVPALCGQQISTQVMGICVPTPIGNAGTYSSPCLTWVITAS